jgi:hypothetical protein
LLSNMNIYHLGQKKAHDKLGSVSQNVHQV